MDLVSRRISSLETILQENIPTSFVESELVTSVRRDDAASNLVRQLPSASRYPTSLLFRNINDVHNISPAEMARLAAGKYLIARWFWEMQQIPEEWVDNFNRFDEIWVSSRFNQEAMQEVTSRPIVSFPHGLKSRSQNM